MLIMGGITNSIIKHYTVDYGVTSSKDWGKFDQLCSDAQKKFGKGFTETHKQICAILAQDPNATIEDVEKMYKQVKEKGVIGGHGEDNAERLKKFADNLKMVPGFSQANLTAENFMELLQIYNTSLSCPIDGMTGIATFFQTATDYIADMNKPPELNVDRTVRENLAENTRLLGAELLANITRAQIIQD
jgi:hypothetical protein